MNLETLFGNDHPVSMEIGMGKGLFMQQKALDEPTHNFLGIERVKKFLLFSASRIEQMGLGNVKLFSVEAREFIERFISDREIQNVYILFPDPWPKRRHRNRRLVQKDFLLLLREKLKDSGVVHITTDHKEYHQWICKQIEELEGKSFISLPAHRTEYITNFQRKYEKQGKDIYFTRLQVLRSQ
ncbi:MAG: tRNA (guanosine(46)-N7)-methyltransferase TrmB [Bdellovibrionales bacterium]|nr:tRNA (guanosine(46)-N7)-methyltransferase TrmB [Bdellovibrionales bacterium]